jgi:hypothetical protein
MIPHGPTELFKPLQEEILFGERAIKIIIFLLVMSKRLILQVELT